MNEEAFNALCRKPGTRCNEIMTMIENGVPLDDIARKYNTTKETIRVYENALRGKLEDLQTYDITSASLLVVDAEKTERIIREYEKGESCGSLARRFHLTRTRIYTIIRNARRKGRLNDAQNKTGFVKPISEEEAALEQKVIGLFNAGMKRNEIMRETGVDGKVYKRILKRRSRKGV